MGIDDKISETSTAAITRASSAPLPKVYEAAKAALAQCTRVDECAEWANKAQALASYARQAKDKSLQAHATRIQARAIRRCGELLKRFDARPVNAKKMQEAENQTVATVSLISQKKAARDAGLSERQQTTAVRVANVPPALFEEQVESDNPPTVTKLAEQGKKTRPIDEFRSRDPKSISAATWAQGELRDFAAFCATCDWQTIIAGSLPDELLQMRRDVDAILKSLNSLRRLL